MTAANILLYIALIGFVLFKKVQGQPMRAPLKLFGPPAVLVVLGFQELTGGKTMSPTLVALTAVGAALSLGLGLLRGRADKVTTRDGAPFVQWGKASLTLFATNIAAKLVLDLIAVATGGSASMAGKSLVFTLGLTLLGEAIILWSRTGGATAAPHARNSHTRGTGTAAGGPTRRPVWSPVQPDQTDIVSRSHARIGPPIAVAANENGVMRSLSAVAQHHQNHREQRRERHARRHDRGRGHDW